MNPSRRAFTLIELVVSALLAALMLVALLNITWAAYRESQELTRNDLDRAAVGQLVDLIVADVQNARGMNAGPNQLALHGFLGRGLPGTPDLVPSMLPGSITYDVIVIGQTRTLVRRSVGAAGDVVQLAWKGFGGFQVDVLQTELEPDELDGEAITPPVETGGLAPIPPVIRLTMTSQSGRVLHREVIHHHEI